MRNGRPCVSGVGLAGVTLCLVLGGCPTEEDPADDDDVTTPVVTEPQAVIGGEPLLAIVGEGVAFDGRDSEGAVLWRWDFGDGTRTEWSEDPSSIHTYERPGHYLVALEVQAVDGRPDADTARITVSWPAGGQVVTQANLMDSDWDEDAILVVATDFDAVANYRPADGAVSGWYDTCSRPKTLSHSRSLGNPNALFVACPEDHAVEVWDTATQQFVGRVELPRGSQPWSVVAPTQGVSGWVTLQATGQVAEIVAPLNGTPTLGRILDVLPDPRGLALVDGTLYVSRHRSPDDAGNFATVDLSTDTVTVHELAIHPGPDSDTTSRGVPSYLQQIGVSPDGRAAWFPSLQANVERGLYLEGNPLTHETSVRAVVSSVAIVEDEATFADTSLYGERDRALLDDRGLAVSVAFSPLGDWTYVGFLGMESVSVLDSYTLQASGSVPGLEGGAEGLLTSPDGQSLFAASRISRTLWEIDLADGGLPEIVRTVSLEKPGAPDPIPPEVFAGRLIFQDSADPRMTQDGYISCAVCHLDGTDDHRTWDFTDRGEGLRNTISLVGRAGTGHGPMHWSANFDEVQDFENDVRDHQAGAGFLTDEDWALTEDTLGEPKAGRSEALDALAAYVTSLATFPLSPFRQGSGEFTPSAEAGQAIFEDPDVGCVSCHPPPLYTDSRWLAPGEPLLQDVGTITEASGQRLGDALLGLDTPTLLGLAGTAPYLHDGSATTLREVLVDRNPEDAHGVTSTLSEVELVQLERFLMELE